MRLTSFFSEEFTFMALNLVNMVEKQDTPKDSCIKFDPSETIRAPNGPLYIVVKVKDIPCRGALVDPFCVVNIITKDYLFTLRLHKPIYDGSSVVVKLFDGFSYLPLALSPFLLKFILNLWMSTLLSFLHPSNSM